MEGGASSVATEQALAATPPVGRGSHYRPHLDGLRAVAVYLVVAFHAGLSGWSGGFIGVDVFFVLSGYLVTQLLLRDLTGNGRIRLGRFYARRYRRLLPAAFVTLTVTAIAFVLVATAAEVADSVGAFRASFLYYANWYFIAQSNDYFGADINNSPVIHFWSLAVEEQFYLVWPLLLGGVFAASRRLAARQMAVVRGAIALAALCSVVAAIHVSGYDLNRAYYGTDTRGYQLLAGALLALTPGLFSLGRRAGVALSFVAAAGLGAVIVLGTSALDIATIPRGIAATVATCALIVAIENEQASATAKALSHRAATYLGRVSYGTYLWHWPVIVVLTRETSLESFPLFAVTCVVATTFAATSYHALELPVRMSKMLDRHRAQVIGCGLALSLLGGLVVAPAILDTKQSSALQVTGANGVDPQTLDWQAAKDDIPPLPDCSLASPENCTIVHGTGQHVLLLGDSNARMYIPTFTAIANREHLTLSVAAAPLCPWQEHLFYLIGINDCRPKQRDWYGGLIDTLNPDVIIAADRPMDDPASATIVVTPQGGLAPGDAGYDEALRDLSSASLARLRHGGRKVVLVEPIPIAQKNDDPINCLSSASKVDDCIYQANAVPTPLESFYRTLPQPGAVWTLDFDRFVCPRLPVCDPVVNGVIVKRDQNHITGTYAAAISDDVDAMLRQVGVLP